MNNPNLPPSFVITAKDMRKVHPSRRGVQTKRLHGKDYVKLSHPSSDASQEFKRAKE